MLFALLPPFHRAGSPSHIPVADSLFSGPQALGTLNNAEINEASGLVASRSLPGTFWTHNDSGDTARIFLLDGKGRYLATFFLKSIRNRDWEDIAMGPGPVPGVNYLYLGEIGDNQSVNDTKYIYRFPEPNLAGMVFPATGLVENAEVFAFQFPNGNRDAETLMVDPASGDVYIATKREPINMLFRLPAPLKPGITDTLEFVTDLPFTVSTGGDISPDGTEILIKNYVEVFYWKKQPGESLAAAFKRPPVKLPYQAEPQGEAIAWDLNGKGYYTLSEIRMGVRPVLYFYSRLANK